MEIGMSMLSVPAGGDSVSHQVDHRVTKDPSQPTNRPNLQTGLGRAASHATATTVDTSCHTDQKDARQKVKPAQPAEKSDTLHPCVVRHNSIRHTVCHSARHTTRHSTRHVLTSSRLIASQSKFSRTTTCSQIRLVVPQPYRRAM